MGTRDSVRLLFLGEEHARHHLVEIQSAIERTNMAPGEVLAAYLPPSSNAKRIEKRPAAWVEKKEREHDAGDLSREYLKELRRWSKPKGHFSRWFDKSVHEIRDAELEDWADWLSGRVRGAKTRRNIPAGFRSFISWLYRRREIHELSRDFPWPTETGGSPFPTSSRNGSTDTSHRRTGSYRASRSSETSTEGLVERPKGLYTPRRSAQSLAPPSRAEPLGRIPARRARRL